MKNGFKISLLILLAGCTTSRSITKPAEPLEEVRELLQHPALQRAHVGICVFDAGSGNTLFSYQGDKYFVPASNIKIATCYAAMKYLGDSIRAFRYSAINDSSIIIEPNGDPTFLHPDFKNQRASEFLSRFREIKIWADHFDTEFLGNGWSWNDLTESYMAPRSFFPLYGNLIQFNYKAGDGLMFIPAIKGIVKIDRLDSGFSVSKDFDDNDFIVKNGSRKSEVIPFTPDKETILDLVSDTIDARVLIETRKSERPSHDFHSVPTDSLLKPMMHNSDNFFAEQSLLMVSNELLGKMNEARVIDTILKTALADLPHPPRWVDGSGLSRYNLFTPEDMVMILDKMRAEFGMDRIREIFPTGKEGTLSNYYVQDSGSIYAKTGTLSGVVSLGGFLVTKTNRLLVFSVMVNNHHSSATLIRRAVEAMIIRWRERL